MGAQNTRAGTGRYHSVSDGSNLLKTTPLRTCAQFLPPRVQMTSLQFVTRAVFCHVRQIEQLAVDAFFRANLRLCQFQTDGKHFENKAYCGTVEDGERWDLGDGKLSRIGV